MLHLNTKNQSPSDNQWWGYWDADLTIPLHTIEKMFKTEPKENTLAIWSSRYKSNQTRSQGTLIRRILGQVFSKLVQSYFKIDLEDTQCGAKVFRANMTKDLFQESFISRWLFDIELFYRLPTKTINEFSIEYWQNQTGSKVSLIKDGLKALKEMRQIKRKYSSSKAA